MVLQLLLRLLRRLEPREGWPLLLLPLATLLLLAFSAHSAGWVPGLGWLLARVTLVAYLLGFVLARSGTAQAGVTPSETQGTDRLTYRQLPQVSAWLAAVFLAVLGVLVVSLLVGWGGTGLVGSDVAWYLRPWARAGAALAEMGYRLTDWLGQAGGGGAQQDDAVFSWIVGLVVWASSAWAAWWIFRRAQAWIALIPAGVLLGVNGYFAWDARVWLPAYMAGLVLTQASMHLSRSEATWRRSGMDYSEDARLDTTLAALGLAGLALVSGMLMPRVVFQPTARFFYRLTAEPLAAVQELGEQMFPGLRQQARPLVAQGGAGGGMPRAFLLGSGPELGEQLVLEVRAADLAAPWPDTQPAQQVYWRAVTYSLYDGRGWWIGPGREQAVDAGQPWIAADWPQRRPLRQQVTLHKRGEQVLFAAGEPLAVDHPYAVLVRQAENVPEDGPADQLVALKGTNRRYSVLSMVPAVDQDLLRAAGTGYPPSVADLYLALPDIPDRVRELAEAVAGDAGTPYDQALALEGFLRTYRYDLAVTPAPPGRDAVDYFLFDLQAGYCDYYASAMAVMARSLGIPARLAAGYATGVLDEDTGAYRVTEDQAHSWVELYFPGVGWIPFEPTAAREVFTWPESTEPAVLAGAGSGEDVAAELQRLREDEIVRRRLLLLLAAAGVIVAAGSAWAVVALLQRRQPVPGLEALYERLGRWGARLGRVPGPGETAGEYGRGLSQQVGSLEEQAAEATAAGILTFVADFESAQYGPDPERPARAARSTWRWLEASLRRLWLVRLLRPGLLRRK